MDSVLDFQFFFQSFKLQENELEKMFINYTLYNYYTPGYISIYDPDKIEMYKCID